MTETREEVVEWQERVRAVLRADGWPEWREEDVREPGRLEHGGHLFSPEHRDPDGPLVRWKHPEVCECKEAAST